MKKLKCRSIGIKNESEGVGTSSTQHKMFKYSISYLKYEKINFIMYICLSYCVGGLALLTPIISGEMLDTITQTKNIEPLVDLIIVFGGIQICKIVLQYAQYLMQMKTQTKTAFLINADIIRHIQFLPLTFADSFNATYMTQRINSDSNVMVSFVMGVFSEVGINILTFIFSAIVLINISPLISFCFFILLFIYVFLYIIFKKKIFNMTTIFKENQSSFFSTLGEQLENIHFIQVHSLQNIFSEKLKKIFRYFFGEILKTQKFFFFYSSLDTIINTAAQVFVYLVGGSLVISKKIGIGEFTIVISFFQYLQSSLKYFSDLGKSYQENVVSYKRLKEITDYNILPVGTVEINKIDKIKCENLSFVRNSVRIIENFCYEFNRGFIYCIKGNNGVGKTTLIDILLGLHMADYSGNIYYNEIDIKKINVFQSRLNNFSIIEQFPYVFCGSIEENIFLTKKYRKKEILKTAGEFTAIWDKLSQKINERGGGISGGERQKIALLRLFAKQADVLILDEPTSALDFESTIQIMEYLKKEKEDKIIIIVSHDIKVEEYCDFIIEL